MDDKGLRLVVITALISIAILVVGVAMGLVIGISIGWLGNSSRWGAYALALVGVGWQGVRLRRRRRARLLEKDLH